MVQSSTESVYVAALNSELTIGVNPVSGPPGDVGILGSLYRAGTIVVIPGVTVDLWVNGVHQASTTTNSSGRYAFTVNFPEGSYSIYTSWDGNVTYNQDASPPVEASYAKIQAAISISVSPSSGPPPLAVTISGRLSRADTDLGLGAKTADLYRNGVKINSATTKPSAPLGVYEFHDTISAAGRQDYYVVFEGDDQYAGCEEEESIGLPCTVCGNSIPATALGSEVECEVCYSVFETVIV